MYRECVLHADASYVVHGCSDPTRHARVTRPNGDLWKLYVHALSSGRSLAAVRVTGHIAEASCEHPYDQTCARGNGAADLAAKAVVVPRIVDECGVPTSVLFEWHSFLILCQRAVIAAVQRIDAAVVDRRLDSWGAGFEHVVQVDMRRLRPLMLGTRL